MLNNKKLKNRGVCSCPKTAGTQVTKRNIRMGLPRKKTESSTEVIYQEYTDRKRPKTR